jgi:hypothetical protein
VDAVVLYGAITALFGVLSAVARELYVERGRHMESKDKRIAYYEEQVMPTMNRLLDAQEKQGTAMAVLTRVVEKSLERQS